MLNWGSPICQASAIILNQKCYLAPCLLAKIARRNGLWVLWGTYTLGVKDHRLYPPICQTYQWFQKTDYLLESAPYIKNDIISLHMGVLAPLMVIWHVTMTTAGE